MEAGFKYRVWESPGMSLSCPIGLRRIRRSA